MSLQQHGTQGISTVEAIQQQAEEVSCCCVWCKLSYLRIGSEGTNLYFASSNCSMWVYDNGKEGLLILLLCGLSPYINA